MSPDQINGLFELVGGILLLLNSRRMYKDKEVKGVSLLPCLFFTSWGYWNMYFYPSLEAWWSFYGGIAVSVGNTVWISMVVYYKLHPAKNPEAPRPGGLNVP